VELRGFEPLTYSMRTSRLGRLLLLTSLGEEENARSTGWRRLQARTVAEATADALRTLDRFNSTEREKALAVKARAIIVEGHPPPFRHRRTTVAIVRTAQSRAECNPNPIWEVPD
jgi:hypothetical protein